MSYSRRQLYAMGEPLGDGATRREVGGKIIYGGGGGGGNPETQRQIVDLPEWAKPYAKESLGKAQALSATPYQAYGGERIAQFTPLQKQAFGRAEGQQVAGQVGFGTGLAGLAGISSFGDQGTAASFMSPYMDAVVQQQMESAQRQADIAGTQRGAQAVRAGAFGGSRQAVENAEAARALASQKGQIQATGLQSAFERAQQQFNQEQATRLNAAQTLGQLGQQQFGQQMDITGQQAQFGGQQRQATQDILGAQYQDFLNQQRAPYDQLAFMTSMIRGTPMGQTTTMYQPPPSTTSQLIGLGTAAAGAYGASQGKAAGGEVNSYAAGGIASLNQPEMAAMAGGMSDQQLQQTQGLPSITDLARMTLAAEAQQRAQMRQAAMQQQAMAQQQPQGTVAEEQMAAINAMDQGLGGLEVPDDMVMDEGMAGGGIVAFAQGDEVELFPGANDQMALYGAPGPSVRAAGAMTPEEERKRRNARARSVEAIMAEPSVGAAPAGIQTTARSSGAAPTTATTTRAPAGIAGLLPANIKAMQDKYRSEIEDAARAGETLEADRLAAIKRDQEEMGEIGVEREKRLKAQEKALEGAEGKNFNMALIEAGLAIMSGNSANAFENIGKGAMVGTKAYTTGMERIQSRKEKLDESLMALDELRYGDKKASKKDLRDAEAAVNKAKQQTATALAAVTGEEAKVAVDMYTKNLDRQATLAAASMRSSKEDGLTANQKAAIRDKAVDNVKQRLEKDFSLMGEVRKNPAKRDQLIQKEIDLLMGTQSTLGGATGAAPTRIRFDAQGNIIQ